ncbi:MAG TPA: hypothetical protein VFI74_02140 [Candidatus Saccharimonadales bacterium]|nr:hypothetical protein [Candidatus Saccharimonadales bacterium]
MGQDDTNGTDPLQAKDDLFNPNVDEVRLEDDGDSPDAPADDVAVPTHYNNEHPLTDTGIDEGEAYDAGPATAAGFDDQEEEPDTHVKPVELDHED